MNVDIDYLTINIMNEKDRILKLIVWTIILTITITLWWNILRLISPEI